MYACTYVHICIHTQTYTQDMVVRVREAARKLLSKEIEKESNIAQKLQDLQVCLCVCVCD